MAKAINEYKEIMEALAKPLELNEIEWRVQSATGDQQQGYRVLVLPYVTSRAVMNRLDEVVGPHWKDHYEPVLVQTQANPAIRCTLSLKIGDEWVSREDAAELSAIEPIKGGYSGALKRAGSKWKIGRYLYDLPQFWVPVKARGEHYVGGNFSINKKNVFIRGYFDTPKLPSWALPAAPPKNNQNTIPNHSQQQSQQAPTNNRPSNNQPIVNVDAESHTQALNLVKGLLQYLGVPLNLVPQLLEQSSGCKVPYEQASIDELGKLYHLLKPAGVYVESCAQMGMDASKILFYANLKLAPFIKQRLQSVYELVFHMTKELAEQTIALAREEVSSTTPSKVG